MPSGTLTQSKDIDADAAADLGDMATGIDLSELLGFVLSAPAVQPYLSEGLAKRIGACKSADRDQLTIEVRLLSDAFNATNNSNWHIELTVIDVLSLPWGSSPHAAIPVHMGRFKETPATMAAIMKVIGLEKFCTKKLEWPCGRRSGGRCGACDYQKIPAGAPAPEHHVASTAVSVTMDLAALLPCLALCNGSCHVGCKAVDSELLERVFSGEDPGNMCPTVAPSHWQEVVEAWDAEKTGAFQEGGCYSSFTGPPAHAALTLRTAVQSGPI